MDIKELMIGDWVYNKHHCKNIQITPYDFFTHTHNKHGEQTLTPFPTPTFGRDLEPIPLTAEILERNGFSYLNITDVWIWREGSSLPIHLDNYNEDGWRLLINCDNIPCECKFVHQLQHALRLCGIEKYIIL